MPSTVSRARSKPRAESIAGTNNRHHVGAILLTTLVIATSLWVVFADRPAAADQIASLESRAKAVSQQLVEDQLQADSYQQQYSVASAKLASDDQLIADTQAQIAADQQQIAADTQTARGLVVTSYMDGGADVSHADASVFSDNEETAQVVDEYAGIATGNLQDALDQLNVAQRGLQAREAVLQQQQVADEATQQRQAQYLSQADATTAQLQSVQSEVTGQLATAVADQARAQQAAVAAALAAARRPSAPTGGVAAPTLSIPDPTLNPFLQCVVQAESGGNYAAVSPNGEYMGAFQFSQATWNEAARAAGLPQLVGVPPNRATKAEQDTVAVTLYSLDGERPWLGDRCAG